ncbi:MAG: glycosyltransferase family 9 protein [Halomonas subglaciescola]|nr:glycosyltransferase family 9 protein [Halomonas subglaciescola]
MSHPPPAASRILVVRNDKLGDFMLAWPALATLKQADSSLHISVLVPHYTAAMAAACPWVDEVMIDPGDKAERREQNDLLARMKASRFDAVLTLFSTPRIGSLCWRAGIVLRIAPATKWAQVFYNVRIRQRRSRSEKPEYQYNVELAQVLLKYLGKSDAPSAQPPFWPLDAATVNQTRTRLLATIQNAGPRAHDATSTNTARQLIVIHPGSGGSAVNLTLDQYATLAHQIQQQIDTQPDTRAGWLISAGPGEEAQAAELCQTLQADGLTAALLPASANVVEFGHSLASADLLIAGSTGPLHMAGCLNIATAGFYPAKRSATALRWQTCNAAGKRLAFSPPPNTHAQDMSAVDIPTAARSIAALLMLDSP